MPAFRRCQIRLSNNSISSSCSPRERKKVLVIGAGISGLSVAYRLKDSSFYDVEIVEARNRVGGRIFPHLLMDGKTRIDLGGQWVHEATLQNPIRNVMEELLLPNTLFVEEEDDTGKRNQRDNFILYGSDGIAIEPKRRKQQENFLEAEISKIKMNSLKDPSKVHNYLSMKDILDDLCSKNVEYSNNSVDKEIQNALSHYTECYEGGRISELSASLLCQDELYQYLGGPDRVPNGTYHRLLQAILSSIEEGRNNDNNNNNTKIRYNSVVSTLQYSNNLDPNNSNNIKLTLHCGTELYGDYCVCTLPLGVLQRGTVHFHPPLPNSKVKAINAMGMGILNKVILKFDQCFWDTTGGAFFTITDIDLTNVKTFYDATPDVGVPVLIMFLGGDAAWRIGIQITEEEAVQEAMERLKVVYGDAIPNPVESKVTTWNLDPYSYGSYSFAKVGSDKSDYEEVARPVGHLLFAGEHTSKNAHSTVHGAWATGVREAERLEAYAKL
jgi:polyamine oxidase